MRPNRKNMRMLIMFKHTGMYTPESKPSLELFLASTAKARGSPLSSGVGGMAGLYLETKEKCNNVIITLWRPALHGSMCSQVVVGR